MRTRILTTMLILGALLVAGFATGRAWAIESNNPITDYANYPANSGTSPGCDASGVHGVEFSLNGGAPLFNLASLPAIHAGDELEVSYTDVSDACLEPVNGAAQPLSLAMKSAVGPTFDPTVDQLLELPYVYDDMGPLGGRFTYVLPDLSDDSFDGCYGQLDLVVGRPLQDVGPNGSYYGFSLNGQKQMLVSAWNGSYDTCEVPPTVTTAPPVADTVPPTTTPAPPTTVNETPTSLQVDQSPSTSVEAPAPTTTRQAGSAVAAAAGRRAEMPNTGPGCTWWMVLAGIVGVLLGAGAVVGGTFWRRREII